MQNKRNRHGREAHNITGEPLDSIHLGVDERIRLEDTPEADINGNQQVGNREYNDERYQAKGNKQATVARWIVPPIIQWTGVGYVFSASECSYELPGVAVPIVAPASSFTLVAADPTLDRLDLPFWNENGVSSVKTGTPGELTIFPTVTDPLTQIGGPHIIVRAGSTEPDPGDLQNTVVYNENTEWTGAVVGCTGNFNNATPVFTGFKSVEISAIAINDYIEFTAPANFNPKTFDTLALQLRMKAAFVGNLQNIGVRFYDIANTAISSEVNLGLDRNLINDWQLAGVAISNFTFTSETPVARKIRFRWTRGNADHAGFYMDLIQLQGGIIPPVVAGTVVLQGQVSGSGQTGTPINVVITEKAISEQTEHTDPLAGTEYLFARLASGALVKIPTSLLFSAGADGADGADGNDGREVEIQNSGTAIQWRYVGDPTWITIVTLAAITGPAGAAGTNGTNGTNGADGADGREAEFQVSGTDLQYRLIGDPTWTTIFDLTTLAGSLPPGGTTSQVLTKLSATDGDADWETVKPPLHIIYANEAAMLAGQSNQKEGYAYFDGTKEWRKLSTSIGVIADYREIGGSGGGGADTNAVHYNAADGKTAPEQTQARENIDAQKTIPTTIVDALVAGSSPATANPFVTVSALNSYAYVQQAPSDGKAYVRKSNVWAQLSPYDLKQEGATDGQAIVWSAANSRYQPGTVSGGTITGADTQVTFFDGANNPAGDSGLKYIKASKRLEITDAASALVGQLVIDQASAANSFIAVNYRNRTASGEVAFAMRNDVGYVAFELFGSAWPTVGVRNNALFTLESGLASLGFATLGAAPIIFRTNAGSSGTNNTRLYIHETTGNILVNTITDAGFKLDVNGTARIVTSLTVPTINGMAFTNYTSGGTALKISSNTTGAVFGVQNTNASGFSGVEYMNNANVVQVFTGFNNGNNQEFKINNVASGGYINFITNNLTRFQIANSGNINVGTTTDITPALMNLTSTTKGFLPPRMTTTQRNAIASPVAGLVIYNTTTNKLNVYTTAWEDVTSA